ncbi:MAG: hypothetical protein A2X94_00520 [Bdellovibrionales bacterium GWB1_55_8]|nr:MAG: hypothetical protein A2X94_00520 [Bdellovibrionales bacterium GWB1_55_8]
MALFGQIFSRLVQQIRIRRRSGAALRESHALLHVLFEESFELAGLLTPDGVLIKVNQRARDFIGKKDSELLGKYFWETPWWTHSPELQERLRAAIKAAAGGELVRFESNHLDLHGELFHIDFSLKPARDKHGKVILLIPEGRDITEQKRAQSELKASAQRLRTIIETEPECVKVVGLNGEIQEMNPAGIGMLEASSLEEVRNLKLQDFVTAPHQAAFRSMRERVLKGESGELQFEITGMKGTKRWLETHAVPLRDENGQIRGLLGITRDITAHKASEKIDQQRHELERQLATIAKTAPGALCSLRMKPDGSISMPYVSPRWEEYFQLSQADVAQDASALVSRYHPDDLEYINASVAESAKNMTDWRAEFRILNPARGTIWIEGHSTPVREPDGSIIWHGFITEITQRKRIAAELLAAKNAAELAAKTQAEFLNIAAHELRTPITSLSLILQLAQKKIEKGEVPTPATLNRLRAPADRLSALVADLLDLSRLERGIILLHPKRTNVVDLILECIEEFKTHAPARHFHFEKPETPVDAEIDPTRIYQVLSNFLDNAIKYTPEQGPIDVAISSLAGKIRVSVTDRGAGIAEQQQAHLFAPFARGESNEVIRTSGLGLGLSISRKIVELHGGAIGVDSVEGQGSTFYFELPRKALLSNTTK